MRPGYYRRNGVPYGANAHMTEWFTTVSEPDGNTYLLVTKILEDPQYMNGPYVRTVQFKKQPDATGGTRRPVPRVEPDVQSAVEPDIENASLSFQ